MAAESSLFPPPAPGGVYPDIVLPGAVADIERAFLFALVWGAGGLIDSDDRPKFDAWLRRAGAPLPPPAGKDGTIFDMTIDLDTTVFVPWVAPDWSFPPAGADAGVVTKGVGGTVGAFDISGILVPTVDSARCEFLLRLVLAQRGRMANSVSPALVVGDPGTAKTSNVRMYLSRAGGGDGIMRTRKVNFSSATTPALFQAMVEAELDRRGGKSFGPPGNKHMTLFLDDMSMPARNSWGDQPTLELVRQLIGSDNMAFLDRDKRGEMKNVECMLYVGAMGTPAHGRGDIPARLKRLFVVFSLAQPSTVTIEAIYGRLLAGRFTGAAAPLWDCIRKLPWMTVQAWSRLRRMLLPTPAKFHYAFSLRDISRVFQGFMRVPRSLLRTPEDAALLWKHEADRCFGDKLTCDEDRVKYGEALEAALRQSLPERASAVAASDRVYVDFLRRDDLDEDGLPLTPPLVVYESGGSLEDVRPVLAGAMARLCVDMPARPLALVLFDDAVAHVLRVARVLGMPRGNALLVGVGGSGKQSLSRLAAYVCGLQVRAIAGGCVRAMS